MLSAEQRVFTQEDILARISSEPLVHACVLGVKNKIILERFEPNDMVLITDEESPCHANVGRILKRINSEIKVGIGRDEYTFAISQVKLLFKNDGRLITIVYENKVFEVWGGDFIAHPGDTAKVTKDSHQIVEIIPSVGIGELCTVEDVVDNDHIKVTSSTKGTRLIICRFKVKKGDEVVLDPSALVAIRHLKKAK